MTPPYYTVTVTNVTRGWSYSSVHGTKDESARVQLVEPFKIEWSFEDDLIPAAHMDPVQATVALAARTGLELPEAVVGDRLLIDVRVGTAGKRILLHPYPLQVGQARATLVRHKYRARLELRATDYSPVWKPANVGLNWNARIGAAPGSYRYYWRERLAELAALGGTSVGAPTWWSDSERPPEGPNSVTVSMNNVPADQSYAGKLQDELERGLYSHQPNGWPHTAVTVWRTAGDHPAGYGWVGPSSWQPIPVPSPPSPVIPDPGGQIKVELVPAPRAVQTSLGLPFLFALVSSVLTLVPRQVADGDGPVGLLGVSAAWCELPATARRARENNVGVIDVLGKGFRGNPAGGSALPVDDYVVTLSNGQSSTRRELPTYLGVETNPGFANLAGAGLTAQRYFSGAGADAYAFDGFTIRSKLIPDAIAAWLLARLAPRLPGETDGDNRLVRHVTLYGVEPDSRLSTTPVQGFVVGGELRIEDGDMVWELRTSPGAPLWSAGAPTPITVGELYGASWSTTLTPSVDPNVRVADLDLTDY